MKWKQIKSVVYLIVHCAATKEDHDVDANEIRGWHLRRGWFDIGYHYVIKRDGTIEKGRPDSQPGAHARGFNHVSLGICLAGGVESDNKTPEANYTHAQWEALEGLLLKLQAEHPDSEILGHCDLPRVNKACPCFDVRAWWESRGHP